MANTPMVPTIPMVNLGNLYIDGLQLAWVDSTHITVNAGQARDSTNINDISLNALVTVNIGANGVNGLDTGTVAANTFYAVYVIGSSTNAIQNPNYALPGALLSLNGSYPQLPSGYDMVRRLGWILTDGSFHILAFRQEANSVDRWMWYDAGISVLSGGASATYTAATLASAVPAEAVNVIFNATVTPTAAGNGAAIRPTGSSSTGGYVIINGAVAAVPQELQVIVPCNATPSVDYKVTGALSLLVAGYIDEL